MVSFRGPKKAWATPRSVSFRGLIQNCQQATAPLSYAVPPPGPNTAASFEKNAILYNDRPSENKILCFSSLYL